MKKVFKIIGILLLVCITVLIITPFFLESKIDTIVQNYADEHLNAELSFKDINLSLISSFPKAEVNIEDLKITNRKPFEDETLVAAKALSFEMPLTELLKGSSEPLVINDIIANEFLVTLITNTDGLTNYDIVKSSETEANTTDVNITSSGFSFDIQNFEIINSALTYIDETSATKIHLTEFNHQSKGLFSGDTSQLDTTSKTHMSFSKDSTNYVENTVVRLDALIDLNLSENKYTFKDNRGFINNSPIEFNGYVQLLDDAQEIDMSFKNPEASFKDFLAVIPEVYSKNIENVSTTGNFTLNGIVKGKLSETTIPTLDINLISNNASFKYPDLPKKVEQITINASVKNTTGNLDDTFLDVNTLDFKIDEDVFRSEAHIKNLTSNALVNANLDGILNLANVTKAYPVTLEHQLTGILKGKLNTTFDMDAIEHNTYERIKNNGEVSISDFVFSSEDIVNPIQINTANINFKLGLVTLNHFDAQTGQSDFTATGTLNNVLGFLLSDKKLQGNFNVNANTFAVSDFMVEDETAAETTNKTTSDTESLKIPDFLDCTITADAKTVYYDNLTLKNVKGQLKIKDQNAELNNVTSEVFNGKLNLNGNVSTKEKTPNFAMTLDMQDFDISQSFKDLELLKALAPIAKVIEGKLNSTIAINGILDENFAPNLNSISGNALAEVLTQKINADKSPLVSQLSSQLNFIDIKKLNLNDLKTQLSFENGKVAIKPFTIKYDDIAIEVGGSHSFSNSLDYTAVFNVPAKYLGSEVNQLLGSINDPEVNTISVPITANIGGTFGSPKVNTDLTSSVSTLSKQLVDIQKQKLLGKGKDKVNGLLGGLLGGTKNKTTDGDADSKNDSIKKDPVKDGVKGLLGGLLGKKKKKASEKEQDSINNN